MHRPNQAHIWFSKPTPVGLGWGFRLGFGKQGSGSEKQTETSIKFSSGFCWRISVWCSKTVPKVVLIGIELPRYQAVNILSCFSLMLKLASLRMSPFVKHVLRGKTGDQTWICTVWMKCHLSACVGRRILCTMCLEAMHLDKQLVCEGVLRGRGAAERQIPIYKGKRPRKEANPARGSLRAVELSHALIGTELRSDWPWFVIVSGAQRSCRASDLYGTVYWCHCVRFLWPKA